MKWNFEAQWEETVYPKKYVKKIIHFSKRKFGPRLEQGNFFEQKILFGHVLSFIILSLPTPIDSSSGLLKVHVWNCFSKQRLGTLHIFTDNLNATKIIKIYQKALLPSAQRWFIRKNENWLPQEENDPKHRNRLCTVWKQKSDVDILDWLQLPDTNSIENVFHSWSTSSEERRAVKQLFQQIWFIWRSLSRLCYKISRKYASEIPGNY